VARASRWTSGPPTPGGVIHIDDQLTRHSAAREGEDSGVSVEARGDDMARHEAPMHRADIAHRRPLLLRRGLDHDFLVNGSAGFATLGL
jgi:predicted amidohydrolase YtcJ